MCVLVRDEFWLAQEKMLNSRARIHETKIALVYRFENMGPVTYTRINISFGYRWG